MQLQEIVHTQAAENIIALGCNPLKLKTLSWVEPKCGSAVIQEITTEVCSLLGDAWTILHLPCGNMQIIVTEEDLQEAERDTGMVECLFKRLNYLCHRSPRRRQRHNRRRK